MFFFPELGSELEGVWEPMREASQVELESSSESIPRSFLRVLWVLISEF